jgi:hypothetical protein
MTLELSDASRIIAGVVLITVVAVEFGGSFLIRVHRGQFPFTDFQKAFARAMHAHAGVLVILSLVCLMLADFAHLTGFFGWVGRIAVPLAAILIPGGFAASALIGKGATKPNGFIAMVYAGAAVLALGVVSIGIGLLTA